jgi:hypothetical protein
VPDEMILTQQTWNGEYRSGPREDREKDLSMLRGELSLVEACEYVNVRGPLTEARVARAGVRYTTAGRLRAKGLAVVHTPGKIKDGPHVSVVWPDDNPLDNQVAPWPPGVSAGFEACFNEVEGGCDEP